MKKGKFTNGKRAFGSKSLALVLALILLVGCAVGGTLAWLTAETEEVKNVFTTSGIKAELTETTTEYKMIPGWTIDKDPVVTIKADSEDCWVFIQVEESENLDNYIAYAIDSNNWTRLEKDVDGKPVTGVYYCYANDITADRMIKVLGEGSFEDPMGTEDDDSDDVTVTWGSQQVGVKPSVTKQMMDGLTEKTQPTLSFTAYAVQYWKSNETPFTAAEAWAAISAGSTT